MTRMKRVLWALGGSLAVSAVLAALAVRFVWLEFEKAATSFECVSVGPTRPLDSLTTEEWVVALRKGPAFELEDVGDKAAPIIAAALNDPEATEWAKFALSWAKGDRRWMVPILADRLNHPDRSEWKWALSSLSVFGHDAAPAVPAILAGLKSRCPDGRVPDGEEENVRYAIWVLGQIGPAAREAVDLLVKIFESEPAAWSAERHSCRSEVLKTLVHIGTDAVPASLEMFGRVDSENCFELRNDVFFSYRLDSLRPVVDQLSADHVHRRRGAARIVWIYISLNWQLPPAQELVTALSPLVADEDQDVRRYARAALSCLPDDARQAIPTSSTPTNSDHTMNPQSPEP